jgi:hypothetical protein
MTHLTLLLVSLPGALLSSLGIASLNPLTMSGGLRGLDLKKFMLFWLRMATEVLEKIFLSGGWAV